MAKNYLRESRLSHKQAKKTLTSAIVLSELYCFARVLLLLASFFIGWLVLSKLPFAKDWKLPPIIFGVFANLTAPDLPMMQSVVQWAGLAIFVAVVIAVVFNIISAQATLIKAFRDVDPSLFGNKYLEAREEYKRSIAYIFAYRKLLKEIGSKNNLARGWHKKIHKANPKKTVFKTQEFNSGIVEKELKRSKRRVKKAKRVFKKEEKKFLKKKHVGLKKTNKARKKATKKWKKYWKAQRREAISNARKKIGTKRGNLRILNTKKQALRKEFDEKIGLLDQEYALENEASLNSTAATNLANLLEKQGGINSRRDDIKIEVSALRKYIEDIEEYIGREMGLSKRKVCKIARSNFSALQQIKKYEKRFKKKTKHCKRSLSAEARNKILYRRCRNVRELLFPEKTQMRPNYIFQFLVDTFDFLQNFRKQARLGVDTYYDQSRNYKSVLAVRDYFESYDIDPDAYEVNGYDEGIRKGGRDFTQWKRGAKKGSIYLYECTTFKKYTYNKGFCIDIRNVAYYTFLAFFAVGVVSMFKEIAVMDYFKSLYLMFIPVGIGTLFHFILGCWAGTIVKIRADEDIGEWFDITIADRFDRNVGELLPLRNYERRSGSVVKNTRRNRAFILQRQAREHSVTLYFFRNICQFIAMVSLMCLEISFINKIAQNVGEALKVGEGMAQIIAWVVLGVLWLSLILFRVISRYVYSMNEYNVDCMEDDVRIKARHRYRFPMFSLMGCGAIFLVVLILMGLMEISSIVIAGLFFFLALIAWLADCVIHHRDVDVGDYGFFMDDNDERDPSDY